MTMWCDFRPSERNPEYREVTIHIPKEHADYIDKIAERDGFAAAGEIAVLIAVEYKMAQRGRGTL